MFFFERFSSVPHQELLSALLLAEQNVGSSLRWRLHEKLLQRYSCLARLLPGDLLHQNFSPRIFSLLITNVSDTPRHTAPQEDQVNSQVTFALVSVIAEGVAGPEGSGSNVLHISPLQPQTGAASGDDGSINPRSELLQVL